jgi:plastocyanin
MTNESPYTRRRMVQLSGAAAAVGLAGCSGAATGGDGSESEAADTSGDDHDEEEGGHDEEEGGHDEEEGGHDEEEGGHDEEEDGHDDEHGHETVGEPTATAEVGVNTTDDGEAHFGPHVTRVEAGGTVTWVLESGSHTATAYHPDNDQPQLVPDGTEPWDSGMLSEEGETFERTFETEGVYHYYCAPHETGGMIGSVIVGEPDAHGQPALDGPPEDKPQAVREKIGELNQMCNEALGHEHD